MKTAYADVYAAWLDSPESFWAEVAGAIHWYKKWDRVLDVSRPPFYRWFTGGMVNTCYNAIDRHVEHGRGNQPALIYDSPVTGTIRTFTYRELLDEVARFAGVLSGQGLQKGDRVIIYMPMVPEALVADAGLRAGRRNPLGGLRWFCFHMSSRTASMMPGRS